jgi:hypothetical protein
MDQTPFSRRLNIPKGKPIDKEFPTSARIALGYLLADLNSKQFLANKHDVFLELNRL